MTDLVFCLYLFFVFCGSNTSTYIVFYLDVWCAGKLASKPPPSSLMSLPAIASLLCQATVVVVIQLTSFIMVQQYSWYSAHKYSEDGETIASYENYAVFTISALQYVILTIAFHRGPPYVGYIFNNYILISCLILIASCTVYLILNPAEEIQTFVELKLPPMHFRITIIILGLINLVLAVAIERFVCDYLFSTVLKRRWVWSLFLWAWILWTISVGKCRCCDSVVETLKLRMSSNRSIGHPAVYFCLGSKYILWYFTAVFLAL